MKEEKVFTRVIILAGLWLGKEDYCTLKCGSQPLIGQYADLCNLHLHCFYLGTLLTDIHFPQLLIHVSMQITCVVHVPVTCLYLILRFLYSTNVHYKS